MEEKTYLSIVAVFLMDLIKADTLSVEIRVKGAENLSMFSYSFGHEKIKGENSEDENMIFLPKIFIAFS